MKNTLQQLLSVATSLTRQGRLLDATRAIQRALQGANAARVAPETPPTTLPISLTEPGPATLDASATHPGGNVFEVDMSPFLAAAMPFSAPADVLNGDGLAPRSSTDAQQEVRGVRGPGAFTSGTHTHLSQTRRYKLFTPADHTGRELPLVVMLHGCTQDPDDFAAGTGMNEAAREQGFYVLYPEQSQAANPSRCWNWFKHGDQRRDGGEPALLASMTQTVMERRGIDRRRIFIAGLSAGGAMAIIVAEAYPEIFAAVGVHSGLPRGAAANVMEALAVMKSGAAKPASPTMGTRAQMHVPTIVFHGDQDRTVHPRNGEQVIAAVLANAALGGDPSQAITGGRIDVEQGSVSQGRRYTRSTHRDASGNATAEHWLVHGAGHAWSGGDAQGSYTDASGPDATREMLRFFFERRQRFAH